MPQFESRRRSDLIGLSSKNAREALVTLHHCPVSGVVIRFMSRTAQTYFAVNQSAPAVHQHSEIDVPYLIPQINAPPRVLASIGKVFGNRQRCAGHAEHLRAMSTMYHKIRSRHTATTMPYGMSASKGTGMVNGELAVPELWTSYVCGQ